MSQRRGGDIRRGGGPRTIDDHLGEEDDDDDEGGEGDHASSYHPLGKREESEFLDINAMINEARKDAGPAFGQSPLFAPTSQTSLHHDDAPVLLVFPEAVSAVVAPPTGISRQAATVGDYDAFFGGIFPPASGSGQTGEGSGNHGVW